MKRYQECNFIVRLYRRLKYQPICFIYALWCFFKVAFLKLIGKETESPVMIFKLLSCMWQVKAHWYYTWEEVRGHLHEDRSKSHPL